MLPTHLAWGWKGSRRTRQPPLCRARGSRRLALLHGHASLHSFPKLKNRNKNQTEGVGRGLGTWHRGQVEPTGRRAGLRSRRTPAELQGPSYNEQPENTVFNNKEMQQKTHGSGTGETRCIITWPRDGRVPKGRLAGQERPAAVGGVLHILHGQGKKRRF